MCQYEKIAKDRISRFFKKESRKKERKERRKEHL